MSDATPDDRMEAMRYELASIAATMDECAVMVETHDWAHAKARVAHALRSLANRARQTADGSGTVMSLRDKKRQAERERDQLRADALWRHDWHQRIGRGANEPEGKFYERIMEILLRVVNQ